MKDFTCPKCGNTTSQKGITLAYLEWRLIPVVGCTDEKILANYSMNEGESIGPNDKLTGENIPDKPAELEHYHCTACGWHWPDERGQDDKPAGPRRFRDTGQGDEK